MKKRKKEKEKDRKRERKRERGNFDFFSHSSRQFFDSSISLKILKIPWDLENLVGS